MIRPWLALALVLAAPVSAEMIEPITPETARAWSFLSDRVMGGVSTGAAAYAEEQGRGFLHLTGMVSTANRGGFVQMRRAVRLPPDAQGIVLSVRGDGQRYFVHLRSAATRPWQFHQAGFDTTPDWREIRIPLRDFQPRGGAAARLRPDAVDSLGIAAYGREQRADIALAGVGFY
ncbi:CIA30 family protein [Rhodovulum tesquicola]|uniref:Complex I intermediate-associated protein 30 (CIA30) n=1 Tax=Rhodovulum steppense TaxID=540251 RepID=A0A4R1YUU2_9RHOB|nr:MULTISPECIES: CIA30 family protein [Rhodovulum]MCO8145510.1 CIA30 family protein [Rhodovulum tesquicola]TCM84637.1 complex I intermediate-associated protein 30 (CIA30) [Rhodovulum steppense]